jgi:acyl-CoA reductase-like NAD-dependent aldehyde dehydrogenase
MMMTGKIQTINPATGKVILSYDIMSIEQIEHIAKNAQSVLEKWKKKQQHLSGMRTHLPESLQRKQQHTGDIN